MLRKRRGWEIYSAPGVGSRDPAGRVQHFISEGTKWKRLADIVQTFRYRGEQRVRRQQIAPKRSSRISSSDRAFSTLAPRRPLPWSNLIVSSTRDRQYHRGYSEPLDCV